MADIQVAPTTDVVYCTVHPTVETTLRCNKCGRPMCIKCSRRTPVGYRCKDYIKGQQATFYSSQPLDPVIQGAVSVVLSIIAGGLVALIGGRMMFGFWGFFLMISAGSAAGALIADIAHRAVGRRRGQYSWLIVAGGIIVGALVVLPFALFNLIGIGIYAFTATSAAVGRLRFGR